MAPTTNHSLRKSSSGMHVGYSTTGYSNNLRGRNFEYRQTDGKHCLYIDMSGNIRVRNKQTNSYGDALELIEHHHLLKLLQLDDYEGAMVKQVYQLARVHPTAWILQLDFGDKGSFRYSVAGFKLDNIGAKFDVCFITG